MKKKIRASPKKKAKKPAAKRGKKKARRSTPTAKQARFIDEYMIDMNATQAAIRAGYSTKTANQQASRLLANVNISALIEKRRQAISDKLQCTVDDIARELHKCGFANMADYMNVNADGDPWLDFSKLTRDQAAALAEVMVDDYVEGRGKKARKVKRVKFKLVDKKGSLVDLARLLGFITNKHEHTGEGGGPIEHDVAHAIDERLKPYANVFSELAGGSAKGASKRDRS